MAILRACLLMVLLVLPAGTSQLRITDEMQVNAVNFERHHLPFIKDLFGCPPNPIHFSQCHPGRGILNYREYTQARKAAAKLYSLKTTE